MLSYPYTPLLDSPAVKGVDITPRPWILTERIKAFAEPNAILLDIGSGSAIKLLPFATDFYKIIGIEPNASMYEQAKQNIKLLPNMMMVAGYAEQLPFKSDTFDLVTEMLAPHDNQEVHRVLKPNMHAIFEKTGEEDKKLLREIFGEERFYFKQSNDRSKNYYLKEAKQYFSEVIFEEGYWETMYTFEGFITLLQQVPIIKDFDSIRDGNTLDGIKKNFCTNGKVILKQHRYLLTVKK